MIRCLLLLVTRNRHGEGLIEERSSVGATLRIGRGTDCAIHLPDPRVLFLHATLRPSVHGGFALHGNGKVLRTSRGMETDVELPPGSEVMIGPYRLSAEPARAGHDIVLAAELMQPLPDGRNALIARSRTSLAQTALSMRWMALLPAAAILAAFLAWPVWHAQSARPATTGSAMAGTTLAADEAWSPGPVTRAHAGFARDCAQCHQQPFVRVQDVACRSCHTQAHAHIRDPALQARAFGQTRCAQCHREHRSENDLSPGNPTLCVDCHAGALARAAGLPPITDFASQHPAFPKPVDKPGLVFAHASHLSAGGIESPSGRTRLSCASCHAATPDGRGFAPVTMKAHCQACHRLEFEPALTHRAVPHGEERLVMTTLREFYAQVSIGRTPIEVTTVDGLLRRPGGPGDAARVQAGIWAEGKAMAVARDLFERRSCHSCHQVTTQPGDRAVPWRVLPVDINRQWLPRARFPHQQHRGSDCATCHGAAKSTSSTDRLVPGIGTCRSCHAGSQPTRDKLASGCSSCHGFHAAGTPPRSSR